MSSTVSSGDTTTQLQRSSVRRHKPRRSDPLYEITVCPGTVAVRTQNWYSSSEDTHHRDIDQLFENTEAVRLMFWVSEQIIILG